MSVRTDRFRPACHALVLAAVFLATLISTITVAPSASARSPLDPGAVDRYVSDYLDRHGLPGAAVAVVRDGETVHTAGYGATRGDAITDRTVLAVGSVSKVIAAFAVLRLVDAGELDLDDPVVEHLTDFRMADSRAEAITVRQLISHTSGIPDPTIVPPATTVAEAAARVRDWELVSDPGTGYRYSNPNYWLTARLIEVVSGRSYDAYMKDQVFGPLGMTASAAVITTTTTHPGMHRGNVTAYGGSVPAQEMVEVSAGSGDVVTTAQDMARWLAMQQREGLGEDGSRVLSAELIKESHTVQPGGKRSTLGWNVSGPSVDPARVGKSGALSGVNAQVDLVPSSGYGVAVLLPSFTTTREHAYEISSGIIDLTEGRSPQPGAPVPTLIDFGLGLITVVIIGLTVLGVRRSGRWAVRRGSWAGWRYGLRLLPQLIMPAIGVLLFLVVPNLQNNSATARDAFFLWPALAILVVVAALAGLLLTGLRIGHRRQSRP